MHACVCCGRRAGQLLAEALLHATNPALRAAAAEQLQLLCLGQCAPAEGVLWLLNQLYCLRRVVPVAFAGVCGEYYSLFYEVCVHLHCVFACLALCVCLLGGVCACSGPKSAFQFSAAWWG